MNLTGNATGSSKRHYRIAAGAILCVAISLTAFSAWAQQSNAGVQTDSSVIDAQGTAHITRIIPVPKTISPEAQRTLARPQSDAARPQTLEERRAGTDAWQARAGKISESLYPVHVADDKIAGVPVRMVTPVDTAAEHPDRVLINLHGGGSIRIRDRLPRACPLRI